MRAVSLSVGLLLAASATAAPAPAKDAPSPGTSAHSWRELTSDHFLMRTDLSSKAARTLIAQMEFSRAGLVQAVLDGRDERRTRLEVVAFATQREYEPFAGKHGALAFLDHRSGKECIVLGPLKDYLQAFEVSHELTHHLLYLRIPLQPSWFREGRAQFFSSAPGRSNRSSVT